ncbi:DUF268 domain-containing protein [Polynucleobacter asymbioticus]|nr:DUF268 domain-containing protein [Polynucleobacter asymbioticus]
MKKFLIKTHYLLFRFGIDVRKMVAFRRYPRYLRERSQFIKLGGAIAKNYPILYDYKDNAGSAMGQYFHQDLLVASFVHEKNPIRHVDIGSRIDGFVAHVAAFRKIEVLDIRPLNNIGHENIEFLQADLMNPNINASKKSDSLSCLHAIEHFGLGRYGDVVDPLGYLKGFKNMLSMVENDGTFYISFPISNKNEVHFNAHRFFHPHDILGWNVSPMKFKVIRFDYVDDEGNLHTNVDLHNGIINVNDGCGIYTLHKIC